MMDKRTSGSLVLANPEEIKLKAGLILKLTLLISLLGFFSACDFIKKTSVPGVSKDNPGINANLAITALSPSDNTYQMTEALRQQQKCYADNSCDPPISLSDIQYTYDGNGYLNYTVEREPDASGFTVSYRRYIYDAGNNNRLDKVAIAENASSNFTELHDYFYDDENDPSDHSVDLGTNPPETDGYNANTSLTTPKLRKEYICTIDVAHTAAVVPNDSLITLNDTFTEACDGSTADETITYIYTSDGYLYRKEFDVNNDTKIDHQKIYHYKNSELTQVETDNYYNGVIDERNDYGREAFAGEGGLTTLRIFIDNNTIKNPNVDRTVSYELDGIGLPQRECYFGGKLDFLDSKYDPLRDGISGACTPSSSQYLQWQFTWAAGSCWAGGLDDIDPETRAINYLCAAP